MTERKIGKSPLLAAPYGPRIGGLYPYQRETLDFLAKGIASTSLTARKGRPAILGIDLAGGPDETAFAILSPAGMIAVKHGRNAVHEALCVPLVRARRMAEGKPPAQWVVVCWRQKQRILRHAKQLAQSGKDRLHQPFGGEPSAS